MNRVRGRLGNVSVASEKILFSRPKVELAEAEASTAATHADAAAVSTTANPASVVAVAESVSRAADMSASSALAKQQSEVRNCCRFHVFVCPNFYVHMFPNIFLL